MIEMPHDAQAERSVLGCLLIDNLIINEIVDTKINASDFYIHKNKLVMEAILKLFHNNIDINYVTVRSKMSDDGILI